MGVINKSYVAWCIHGVGWESSQENIPALGTCVAEDGILTPHLN